MVKHQCRYCSMLVVHDGIWCGRTQDAMDEAATKRRNRCKHFEFCETDAYGVRDWKAEKAAPILPACEVAGQMTIFDLAVGV